MSHLVTSSRVSIIKHNQLTAQSAPCLGTEQSVPSRLGTVLPVKNGFALFDIEGRMLRANPQPGPLFVYARQNNFRLVNADSKPGRVIQWMIAPKLDVQPGNYLI